MKRPRPCLVDAYGRPVASWFFDSSRYTGSNQFPPWVSYGATDFHSAFGSGDWQNTLSNARWLYANSGIVAGALREMATYAFPLTPKYAGADQEFGRRAEEWLYEWDKVSSTRGLNFNRQTASRLRLIARKVDGDIGVILTRAKDTNFPQVQHVRAHRIADGDAANGVAKGGRFDGRPIKSGVIHNDQGTPIAFRILTGQNMEADQYVDVPAGDMFLVMSPEYFDQFRGLSALTPSIANFGEIKQLREWELYAHRLAASIALIENNEEGEATPGADYITESTASDTTDTAASLRTETFEKGMVRYFKSGTGGKIESFNYNRPGKESQEFEQKIIAQALYGIGWDPNFAMAIKEPGGAWARTVIEKVRRTIQCDQEIEAHTLRRIHGYAVAKAIKSKVLPKPSDGDWFSWEYRPPARLTADNGNEARSNMEAYKLGLKTFDEISAADGKWWTEDRSQREREVRDLITRAKAISKDEDIPLETALMLLEQRAPNPPQMTNNEPEPMEPEE